MTNMCQDKVNTLVETQNYEGFLFVCYFQQLAVCIANETILF